MDEYNLFFNTEYFVIQNIYYFINPKIKSNEPHYHICIAIQDDIIYFVCCTTKFKTIKRFIIINGHPYSTLVTLRSHSSNINELTEETHVNCNECFYFSKDELYKIKQKIDLRCRGKISNIDFQQISIGVNDSPLIEEYIKDLFPIIE